MAIERTYMLKTALRTEWVEHGGSMARGETRKVEGHVRGVHSVLGLVTVLRVCV